MNHESKFETDEQSPRKFYIQSGACRALVQTQDAEGAALSALHEYLDQSANLADVNWLDDSDWDQPELVEALLQLDEDICVSEIGFGRSEAGWFDTAQIMTTWQQLMVAMNRMDLDC